MKKTLKIVILIIAIGVFLFSLYKIISKQLEYKEGTDTYQAIANDAVKLNKKEQKISLNTEEIYVKPESEETIPTVEAASPLDVDFDELHSTNKDIIGWIYSPDTVINYPVLKASDNDYYLRRMANKKYNISGSIFMDYRNNGDLTDINTLIYGHNMNDSDNSMFGTVPEYDSKDYREAHPYIYYVTKENTYILKPVGGMSVKSDADIYAAYTTNDQFRTYLKTLPSEFFFEDVDIDSLGNLVTLSTCSYDYDNARYVLLCVPILIQ